MSSVNIPASEEYSLYLNRSYEKYYGIDAVCHESIVEKVYMMDFFIYYNNIFQEKYPTLKWGKHGECKDDEYCKDCYDDRALMVLTACVVVLVKEALYKKQDIKYIDASSFIGEKIQDEIMDYMETVKGRHLNLKSYKDVLDIYNELYSKVESTAIKIKDNDILNDPSMSKMN